MTASFAPFESISSEDFQRVGVFVMSGTSNITPTWTAESTARRGLTVEEGFSDVLLIAITAPALCRIEVASIP